MRIPAIGGKALGTPGVVPRFVKFAGGNIVSFVLSCNLHRRHMSPGQQATIVASAPTSSHRVIMAPNCPRIGVPLVAHGCMT
jgi:hypothetical protein